MKRVIIAAFASAVIMFVWGFLWWAVSPFPHMALKSVPNEARWLNSVRQDIPESGVYIFPWMPEDHSDATAQEAFLQLHKTGPIGMVFVRSKGFDPMAPSVMLSGFLHFLLSTIMVGFLLKSCLSSMNTYFKRCGFVMGFGLCATFFCHLSLPVWFHHDWSFWLVEAAYGCTAWSWAAFVMAAIIKPPESNQG
ncbi:MAG: hypothetical protein P1V97_32800 [Planctomycetota bacterium]|nr:hypothetical protein [Planctomycetota bacterium]